MDMEGKVFCHLYNVDDGRSYERLICLAGSVITNYISFFPSIPVLFSHFFTSYLYFFFCFIYSPCNTSIHYIGVYVALNVPGLRCGGGQCKCRVLHTKGTNCVLV